MPPPAREPALAVALLAVAALIAQAAEPVVLLDDLRGASALAATPTEAGGLRVVVAEAGAARLIELTVLGESVLSRDEIGPLPDAEVAGLALVGGRCLALTSRGVTSLALDEWLGETKPPTGEPVAGPPASNTRWLFAPGEGTLLRGRLALGRVTRLRRIERAGSAPLALTISPEGYLVTIVAEGEGHRIEFLDPERPDGKGAGYPLGGLAAPRGVAYVGPADGASLLAIDADLGLTRIISRQGKGGTSALAEPVDAPEGAVALAPTPDGDLLVLTERRLLRWRYDP